MVNSYEPAAPARWWHALEDGRIQCDLCPRSCRLREGQTGLCFVREHRDARMVLTTWGRSSGFCIDPIEKKPLHHFLPGTPVLSFGTAGCNLSCLYCQNAELTRSRSLETVSEPASPEAIARTAQAHHCRSVAFTYNDPVVFAEYAIDVARACHELGLRTVAVTAGYLCAEPRREFFRELDAANVDLKAFSDRFYRELTGGRLQPVLDTIEFIAHETGVWLELTTLLIPGYNDSDAEIDAMTSWAADRLGPDVPLHFTAFHPAGRMSDVWPTPLTSLLRARRIAQANGLRFVYTGNVRDPGGERTSCPRCGHGLIDRRGYAIVGWHLAAGGRCDLCAAQIPGVFETRPGTWGSRRQPVHVGRPG